MRLLGALLLLLTASNSAAQDVFDVPPFESSQLGARNVVNYTSKRGQFGTERLGEFQLWLPRTSGPHSLVVIAADELNAIESKLANRLLNTGYAVASVHRRVSTVGQYMRRAGGKMVPDNNRNVRDDAAVYAVGVTYLLRHADTYALRPTVVIVASFWRAQYVGLIGTDPKLLGSFSWPYLAGVALIDPGGLSGPAEFEAAGDSVKTRLRRYLGETDELRRTNTMIGQTEPPNAPAFLLLGSGSLRPRDRETLTDVAKGLSRAGSQVAAAILPENGASRERSEEDWINRLSAFVGDRLR